MAQLSKADVKAVKRASNGRYFAVLKDGKTRFLSADDAKRLRAGGSTTSQGKGKSRSKAKGSTTTTKPDEGRRKARKLEYIGDFF